VERPTSTQIRCLKELLLRHKTEADVWGFVAMQLKTDKLEAQRLASRQDIACIIGDLTAGLPPEHPWLRRMAS
jgi:hypothetical protein